MIWSDPIVEEVWRVRDAYAARFNYDLRAIFRDLKEQEKHSGLKYVSFADESGEVASDESPHSTGNTANARPATPVVK